MALLQAIRYHVARLAKAESGRMETDAVGEMQAEDEALERLLERHEQRIRAQELVTNELTKRIAILRIVILAGALTALALSLLACSGSPLAPAPVFRGWQDGACYETPPDPRCATPPAGCTVVLDPVNYYAYKLVCPVQR